MELPKVLTPEEQARLEKERADYTKKTEEEAGTRNKGRSLADRLTGTYKVDPIDIARAAAEQEDGEITSTRRREAEREATETAEASSFSQEMELAQKGEWNLNDSRFHSAHLAKDLHEINSPQAQRAEQLRETNSAVLTRRFEEEERLAREGKWDPKTSALFVPSFSQAEVNDLKREKNRLFEKLKSLQEENDRSRRKQELENALANLKKQFVAEQQAIDEGKWSVETSSIQKTSREYSPDLDGKQVSATAERLLRDLLAYETKKLSDAERPRIEAEFAKEEALAKEKKWKHEESYFTSIQKEPRFDRFSSALREEIQQKLSHLGMMNLGNEGRGKYRDPLKDLFNEDGSYKGFGDSFSSFREGPLESEQESEKRQRINKALNILGLNRKATWDEAQKSYRKFMMKNHPDRNPNASPKVQQQVKELTEAWPDVEALLKK